MTSQRYKGKLDCTNAIEWGRKLYHDETRFENKTTSNGMFCFVNASDAMIDADS